MNELKNAELRLKTLEAINNSAVDAIITITEHGIIESVNPSTESLFGYSRAEMVGQNVSMLMPSPYRDEHDDYIDNYLATRIPRIIGIGREAIAQKKNGSLFPMHVAVSEVQVGDRRVFAGFIRDHTDLKKYEEQQASLGRIIENSLNEVFIFDPEELYFNQVNRGARQNLGYTLEELNKLTPVDIKPEFTMDQFRSLVRPLLAGETEKLEFSTRHLRKDGTTYDVDINLQVSTYLSKPVLISIVLDVTQRRIAERLLQQQQEEMQAELKRQVEARTAELRQTQAELVRSEKFSTLGKVSGGIAHEIRNPLNAAKTSAYFLLNAKDPSAEKVQEHLERIDRQVSIIDNVITALSDVAKLPECELSPVSMQWLIRDVVASTNLAPKIEKIFKFPNQLPRVMVDKHQISIAFRNLVRNARDAMPDGGRLTIEASVNNDTVVFSVVDTGIGIPKDDLENIMEPLFSTKARGMGLGLSITRAIIEKNLGSLEVESEVGKGSSFRVALKVED